MPPIDPVIQTIIAEALREGPEGMRLVGETIVNRAEQRGLTPADVVRQPYQYTGYSSPGPDAQRAFNDPSAITAAQAAWNLAKASGDPTGGANHYLNPRTATDLSWMNKLTPTMTHGGHAFYTDRPGYTQKGLGPLAPANIAQISPTTAALRQMTSPTNGNTALQTALNQYATRERNRVTPAIPPWAAMGMNQGTPAVQSGALSAAQKSAANKAALMMNQSYVGQNSYMPKLPSNATAAQKAEAARRAALSMGGNFSYAGNQGSGKIPNDRLPPGQPGLPALYGSFSPNQVNAMGIPVNGKSPTQNTITAATHQGTGFSLAATTSPSQLWQYWSPYSPPCRAKGVRCEAVELGGLADPWNNPSDYLPGIGDGGLTRQMSYELAHDHNQRL